MIMVKMTKYNGLNLAIPSLQLIGFSYMEFEIYESHLPIAHDSWEIIFWAHNSLLFSWEQLYHGGKKPASYSHTYGYEV